MNQYSGAEALVRMLQLHGVKHVFGLCGDTSLPFYDALQRLDHGIVHILTRDERSAAYMADAYARVTGKVGVCEGPSGGGATYILPGVVEANESSVALLSITSDVSVAAQGRYRAWTRTNLRALEEIWYELDPQSFQKLKRALKEQSPRWRWSLDQGVLQSAGRCGAERQPTSSLTTAL